MGTNVNRNADRSLRAAIGRLVDGGQTMEVSNSIPAAYDVKEAKDFTVIVDLPGVGEDEISIEAAGGVLMISANRDFDHDLEDADEYVHFGRPYGTYRCSIPLSAAVDAESMTAKYKRGVLKIRIPFKK